MKNLELRITNAWNQQSLWLWLLLPLMLLFWFASSVHKGLYRLGIKKAYKAHVPVWVIGNISVGGSGKTPFLITLVQYLQSKNIQVAVISRGYASDSRGNTLLNSKHTPKDVGDEPYLIYQQTQVPVCVGSNRAQSIELLLENYPQTQVILSDDGLQHHKLFFDFAWILYDAKRGLGNKMLLPVGYLREWSSRLTANKPHEAVLHHGDNSQVLHMNLAVDTLQPLCSDIGINTPSTGKVHAVTGIGYPTRFFNTVSSLGFDVEEHPFADHYHFTVQDLAFPDDLPILVTSKDAVKLANIQLPQSLKQKIWVVPVTAELSPACIAKIDECINTYIT